MKTFQSALFMATVFIPGWALAQQAPAPTAAHKIYIDISGMQPSDAIELENNNQNLMPVPSAATNGGNNGKFAVLELHAGDAYSLGAISFSPNLTCQFKGNSNAGVMQNADAIIPMSCSHGQASGQKAGAASSASGGSGSGGGEASASGEPGAGSESADLSSGGGEESLSLPEGVGQAASGAAAPALSDDNGAGNSQAAGNASAPMLSDDNGSGNNQALSLPSIKSGGKHGHAAGAKPSIKNGGAGFASPTVSSGTCVLDQNNVLNVQNCGALGQGEDDTAILLDSAIPALGDPVGPPNVTLYFPQGVYGLHSGLLLPSYTTLAGDTAGGSTLSVIPAQGPSQNPLQPPNPAPGASNSAVIANNHGQNGNTDITIQNITIRGGGTAPARGYQCWNGAVLEDGIELTNVINPTVINTRVFDVTGAGIGVNGNGAKATDAQITGNIVDLSGPNNYGGIGINLSGIGIRGVETIGAGNGGVVSGNVIGSITQFAQMADGLHCNGCTGVEITGNMVSRVGGDGMGFGEGSQYLTIENNSIVSPGHRGMGFYVPQEETARTTSHMTVEHNRIRQTVLDAGIHVMSSQSMIETDITIADNYILGVGTGLPMPPEPPSCKCTGGSCPPQTPEAVGIILNGDSLSAASNLIEGSLGQSPNAAAKGVDLHDCTNCSVQCNQIGGNKVGLGVESGVSDPAAIANNYLSYLVPNNRDCQSQYPAVCTSQGNIDAPAPNELCTYYQP